MQTTTTNITPSAPTARLGVALHLFLNSPGACRRIGAELATLARPYVEMNDFERQRLDELAEDLASYLAAARSGVITPEPEPSFRHLAAPEAIEAARGRWAAERKTHHDAKLAVRA